MNPLMAELIELRDLIQRAREINGVIEEQGSTQYQRREEADQVLRELDKRIRTHFLSLVNGEDEQ